MGSARHGGRAALIAAVALAAATAPPPPAAAADDATVVLPGTTITALTADLDGDGDREVVRLVQGEAGADYMLEVWGHDGERWSAIGSDALPIAVGVGDPVPVGAEATSLLLMRSGNRDRVLALSAGVTVNDPSGGNCCLTISEVRLLRGGRVDVGLVQRQGGGAQYIQAADVDGDGTDDLVLHEATYRPLEDDQTATLTVLRWGEGRFEPIFERTNADWTYGFAVAETDGADGLDLVFGPSPDGTLHRLGWDGDGLRSEEAHLDIGAPDGGWVMGVADGAIVMSLNDELRTVRWARDSAPTTVDRLATTAFGVLAVVGSGRDALILVQDGFGFGPEGPPSVTVHDLALRPLGNVDASTASAGFWRLQSGEIPMTAGIQRNLFPYNGPIPGGLDVGGAPAYVSSGYLIRPGGADGYEARPIAEMIGMQPVGIAGPQDAWLALTGGFSPPPGSAYLYWDGGGVMPSRLALRPLDQVLRADDPAGVASIELLGAVEVARDDAEATLVARGEGFQAAITAPAGSTVLVVQGAAQEHEVGAEPLIVDILPRGTRDRDQDFDAFIAVVTPDGRGTTQQWTGTFVREMPDLRVSASTDGGSLSATLVGRASSGSRVTANGVVVETDADGSFAGSIDAPIWPSTVVVTARDLLGNETTKLVQVVGVVDYRGLPWAAIMVAATLLGGAVLYVRTPRRRTPLSAPAGDGRLEELELDPIDGLEPRAR